MQRHAPTAVILAALLASGLMLAPAAYAQTPTFSDDPCQAPFIIAVPGDLLREGPLTVVAHDDGAGTRLLFALESESAAINIERDGTVEELGRAALLPDATEVILKRLPGGAGVACDDATVLRVEADLPDGGRWGVLGAGQETLAELLMQPTGEILFEDDFMRLPDDPASWEQLNGAWSVSQLHSAQFSANAFTMVGETEGDGPARAAAGYWFWEDLTLEAAVRAPEGAAGFGLGVALQESGDCRLLRFVPQERGAGMLQLLRVQEGAETTLAEAPAVAAPGEWHRLSISGVAGEIICALDGVRVLEVDDPQLAHGQVLLWVAGGTPVAFDDVRAYSGPAHLRRPVVLSYADDAADPTAAAFINDQYMQQWADERDQWISSGEGVWHAGYYWGDVELAWELNERSPRSDAQMHIGVPADGPTVNAPSDLTPGCHLAVSVAAPDKLGLTLSEGAEVRGEATAEITDWPTRIRLRRTGDLVEALVGEEIVASFTTALPAAGKVGFSTRGTRSQLSALRITSRNLIDSTFRAAPTDWHIGSGEWGVSSRWDCTPRWSWFQGRSSDLAAIWTRRQFADDVAVEFFAGNAMDQPWAPFYRHPGNFCVTLSGSNDTPGSGYSLVFAGWGNTAAGIFRRGELVATAPGFTVPDIIDSLGGTAGREDAHKLHNEWWRIRAERVGSTVRLLVGNKLAVSFDDPDPLPGGAVGIWTLDNPVTVARTRVYFREGESVLPDLPATVAVTPADPLPLPSGGPSRITSTFEAGVGEWRPAAEGASRLSLAERDGRAGGLCLQVENPTAGGSFAVAAPVGEMDLRDHPLLAFDYAIPEGVQIDCLIRANGGLHRLRLTGPEEAPAGMEESGQVADMRADGRWRSATVDLLAVMRPFFAPGAPVVIEGVEFAAYAAPEYLRAGIGGNARGARWQLDNFYLGATASSPVEVTTGRDVQAEARGCRVTTSSRGGRVTHTVIPRRTGVVPVTFASGGRSATDLLAFDLDGTLLARAEAWPERAADGQDAAPDALLDCDFERDRGPLEPWGADAAVELRRVRRFAAENPAGGEWCLEARCTELGGLFGLSLGVTPFEASRYPVLEFDYRAEEELRVDLLVEVEGVRRAIKFTDNDSTWRVIGGLDAVADETWRTATVNLHELLQQAFPGRAALPVTELAFATTGWPGTREDSRWWLDNVRLMAAAEPALEDSIAPVATDPRPARDEAACPSEVAVTITDEGSGVSPADLRLTIGGRRYTIADRSLSFDSEAGLLTWSLPAGVALGEDGARVQCTLEATDLAGNAMEPLEWSWRVDRSLDTEAPAPPAVSYLPTRAVDENRFELHNGGWGNFSGAQVLRRAEGGATGPGCAELRYLGGRGNGFALMRDFGEDWRQYPVVRFRYRLEGPSPSLAAADSTQVGTERSRMGRGRRGQQPGRLELMGTTFDGSRDTWTNLGAFPAATEDWQTAELDIAASLARTNPSLDIHRIFLSITLPPDAAIIIDDYAMYSEATDSAVFEWAEPMDPSGVAGYSWALDAEEDTVPPEKVVSAERRAEFDDLQPGTHVFHLRACDGAGNWSEPVHVPFELVTEQ
jgi:hypothetical protein